MPIVALFVVPASLLGETQVGMAQSPYSLVVRCLRGRAQAAAPGPCYDTACQQDMTTIPPSMDIAPRAILPTRVPRIHPRSPTPSTAG
jgi:hypothetical protein